MVQLTCPMCQKTFTRVPSKIGLGFCSSECVDAHKQSTRGLKLEHRKEGVVALVPIKAADGSVRTYAIVDQIDARWVGLYAWTMDRHGYAQRTTRIEGRRVHIPLHRAVCGVNPGDEIEVDHINRDRLDNRRANLRVVPKYGNRQNAPAQRGTSKYRGVYLHKASGLWHAYVGFKGKTISLGYFKDEEAAAEVALAARKKYMPFATD